MGHIFWIGKPEDIKRIDQELKAVAADELNLFKELKMEFAELGWQARFFRAEVSVVRIEELFRNLQPLRRSVKILEWLQEKQHENLEYGRKLLEYAPDVLLRTNWLRRTVEIEQNQLRTAIKKKEVKEGNTKAVKLAERLLRLMNKLVEDSTKLDISVKRMLPNK